MKAVASQRANLTSGNGLDGLLWSSQAVQPSPAGTGCSADCGHGSSAVGAFLSNTRCLVGRHPVDGAPPYSRGCGHRRKVEFVSSGSVFVMTRRGRWSETDLKADMLRRWRR